MIKFGIWMCGCECVSQVMKSRKRGTQKKNEDKISKGSLSTGLQGISVDK